MRLAEFFQRFYLHDSVIERIEYSPGDATLVLDLELCNFMQPSYQENQPETMSGSLAFIGVQGLIADPDLSFFAWGPNVNGEILKAGLSPRDNARLLPYVKIVATVSNYREKSKTILVLDFLASAVEWRPRKVQIDPDSLG
jgi:hypothetical protein